MKNRTLSLLAMAVLALTLSTPVQADVIGESTGAGKVIHDTATDLIWYYTTSDFTNKTYAEQLTAIAGLNSGAGYFSAQGWHMATQSEAETFYTNASAGPDLWTIIDHNNPNYSENRINADDVSGYHWAT